MRTVLLVAGFTALSLVMGGPSSAELGPLEIEIGLSGGNISNLIKDSTDRETSFSTASLDVGLHPASFAELQFIAQHTMYGQIGDLGNIMYGIGGTLLPLSEKSPFQLYLTGHYRDREYREEMSDITSTEFSSGEYDAMLTAAYRVNGTTRIRTGVSYGSTSYGLDDIRDRVTNDLFAGINATLPGRIALDVEGGVTLGNLDYVPRRTGGIRPDRSYEVLEEGNLNTLYISPRLSRSVGARTGVSVTYAYREFIEQPDSAVVYGYSTNTLSPWASSYEGNAVSVTLKTYLVPRLIVSAGAGYWTKDYLTTVEGEWRPDPFMGGMVRIISTLFARERRDDQRRVFAQVQWPIATHNGYIIEPSLHLSHTYNSSSIDVYDYRDFSVSTGITVRL